MINFFRKKRKALANENRSLKYMRYAVGEIILVVFGILIALSLNNWNDIRKNKAKEKVILQKLKSEYESNLKQLNQKISMRKDAAESSVWLLKRFDLGDFNKKRDSIDYHIARTLFFPTYDPNTGITNELINTGNLYIISNDSIKTFLANWSASVIDLKQDEFTYEVFVSTIYTPFLIENYQFRNIVNEMRNNEKLNSNYKTSFTKVDIQRQNKVSYAIQKIEDNQNFEDYFSLVYDYCINHNDMAYDMRKSISKTLDIIDSEIADK